MWETTTIETKSRRIGWSDRRPHLQQVSSTRGLCIRVLEKGGEGVVTTTDLDGAHVQSLAEKALEIARASPTDPARRFGRFSSHYPSDIPTDDSLFSQPIDTVLERLEALEKKVLRMDSRLKKVVRFQVGETWQSSTLANSFSGSLSKNFSAASFSVELLAEEKGQSEVGWQTHVRRFANDVAIERVANEVAEETLRSLGGKPLPSGQYPVVVHPHVGAQFLELLAEALSAEEVYLGRSFLRGRSGKKIASETVTLMDDPFLKGGVASASFDDEGTPHQTLSVVEDGVLNTYFTDLRSAARENGSSNGHGLKSGLASPPKPQATNFYLKAGRAQLQDMLSSHPKIFLLREIMGLHMADPMTGEFSLGASGFLYEKGRFKRAVRGVTVSGLLEDVLKKITAVGDDLTWYSSTGSPSFLVSEMTVAGT